MGAAQTYLDKLDRVQDTAQKIGHFQVENLQCRREAAAITFSLKLLSGSCKGVLNDFVPEIYKPSQCNNRFSRHALQGLQIKPITKPNSLNTYKRGFHGALPAIWSIIPQSIISKGESKGWLRIKRTCIKSLTSKHISSQRSHNQIKK